MGLIGDRERERAVELLKRHYLRGRLTAEELADRLELALAARRDGEVRVALAELPAARGDQLGGMRAGLEAMWRAAGRAAFVVAVWTLWWAASLVLLIGFVSAVVLRGFSPVTIALPALWVLCTLAARQVTRRGGQPRR
jgi:uncharacterized protein DUF1707